ncbi:MAG: DNA primase [Candidatus Magasanikbacteria bacterium]|nr:DNA primase [Candidatus Magasanikbacteria bacterium]
MSDTQLIKDKLDIVDFISEYVQLKPAGVNHKACCPFHQEKTPSFMVSRERQSWKCFGCGKGGDIFTFVEEMEGMEFVEALKFLAQRAGVELSGRVSEINTNQKNRLKDINSEAARFFHNFLIKMPTSKPALDYLQNRDLKTDTIEEWQIGYIPDQWDLLTKYLLKKGYGIDDLVASGLTIQREGADSRTGRGYYDRFRGRIMFPIKDVHNITVGFTGRLLEEKENAGGKYINTPQSPIYDKSRIIYGLNKAKQEIKKKDYAVVVEGQMDVITSHQAGMKNVIASSGTALTEYQIKLIGRFTKNIKMAFDADDAGEKAALRGINLAVRQGMNVQVIQIPDGTGKDPDECIKKDFSVWQRAVEEAEAVMNWHFKRVIKNRDKTSPKEKQEIANLLLAEIANIPYAVEKDHWLKELSMEINSDVSVLREDLNRIAKNQKKNISNNYKKPEKKDDAKNESNLDIIARNLLSIFLGNEALFKKHWKKMDKDVLSTSKYASLYEKLNKMYNDNTFIQKQELREDKEKKQKSHEDNDIEDLILNFEWSFSGISEKDAENELDKLIKRFYNEWKKLKRTELQNEIKIAEKNNDEEKIKILLSKINEINKIKP